MSTPAASEANQQVVAQAGALEWFYHQIPASGTNSAFTDEVNKIPYTNAATGAAVAAASGLIRKTRDRIVCRVYRNPGVNRYTNLINDAGPIWGVQVFKRPPVGTADGDGFTHDDTRPYQTKWTITFPSDVDTDDEKAAYRAAEDQRLGAAYFQKDGANNFAGQQVLDEANVKQAVCWTLAEAIETGARLAASFT